MALTAGTRLGPCARTGHHPPRPQAREREGTPRRHREGAGLRPREGDGHAGGVQGPGSRGWSTAPSPADGPRSGAPTARGSRSRRNPPSARRTLHQSTTARSTSGWRDNRRPQGSGRSFDLLRPQRRPQRIGSYRQEKPTARRMLPPPSGPGVQVRSRERCEMLTGGDVFTGIAVADSSNRDSATRHRADTSPPPRSPSRWRTSPARSDPGATASASDSSDGFRPSGGSTGTSRQS